MTHKKYDCFSQLHQSNDFIQYKLSVSNASSIGRRSTEDAFVKGRSFSILFPYTIISMMKP